MLMGCRWRNTLLISAVSSGCVPHMTVLTYAQQGCMEELA